MPDLQPNGNPLQLGRSTLRTPGLAGIAVAHTPGSAGMRSAERTAGELDEALATEHIQVVETIEISRTREVPSGAGVTRSTTLGEPAIELTVPDPGPDWGQVVLAVDESGVATWNIARDEQGAVDVTRGGSTRTYVIRRQVPPVAPAAETRGLLGAVGSKVLKVLVFPLVDPIVGEISDTLAGRWEAVNRPYRLRTFTTDDYRSAEAGTIDDDAWARLQGGRALLLLHGTFSRAHSAFGGLPPDFVAWLHERYEGRVFAFDHYTLSQDPRENAEWLVAQVPPGAHLELDTIGHSRGGLVSRVLSEQGDALALGDRSVEVARAIHLATPSAGTVLVDAKHLGELVDTVTNLLSFFPDNGVTDVLQTVITVVKQLAVGAVGGLSGLSAMLPDGPFLHALNDSPKAGGRYYAVAADYEPGEADGLASYARDVLHDRIFGAENDLVIPTASGWDAKGSANFPIEDRQVFRALDAVPHNALVRNTATLEQIRAWLA
ncbi:MAG: hypothetical protein GEU80_07365 [Dehalococcoidia bacterium]|nr:hypothetical protein [Dehalococcoidia bacterium]